MEKNRKKLIAVQLFAALGNAVVGIFLPFLFGRAFGLTTPQIILGMAGVQLFMSLVAYPVNRLLRRLKTKTIIQMGLAFQALFLSLLAIAPSTLFWAGATLATYVLYLVVFYPSWHVALLNSSRDGARGNFTGNLLVMSVGAGIVAPLLSGILLDRGWDEYVLFLSIVMFFLAIFSLKNVELPRQKLSNFSGQWKVFVKYLWNDASRWGVVTEGIQSGTLWILWPIFLGAALGSFTQMGIVIAFAAIAEVVSSKFSGKFTDKRSAQKTLSFASRLRVFDLGLRGFLMYSPTLWMASIVTIGAGILGPVLNISLYTRTCEIAEKAAPRELEWFIAREWILGVSRFLLMLAGAAATYFWGDMILGWFLVGAAITSVGFRRY